MTYVIISLHCTPKGIEYISLLICGSIFVIGKLRIHGIIVGIFWKALV